MKRTRRQLLSLAGGTAISPILPRFAMADAYPTRPVRIFVGFAAGGNFDLIARLVGRFLSEQLEPFVIENRPGAGSNLATEAAIRATPDGYTLLLAGAVNTINSTLFEKLNFDFVKDIAPISGVVQFPNVMMVGPSFPARTVPDFIAYASANPSKINTVRQATEPRNIWPASCSR